MLTEGNDDDVNMRPPKDHSFIYCLHVSEYAGRSGFAADYDFPAEQYPSLAARLTTKWPQQVLQSLLCLRAASLLAMLASIASCVIAVIGTC